MGAGASTEFVKAAAMMSAEELADLQSQLSEGERKRLLAVLEQVKTPRPDGSPRPLEEAIAELEAADSGEAPAPPDAPVATDSASANFDMVELDALLQQLVKFAAYGTGSLKVPAGKLAELAAAAAQHRKTPGPPPPTAAAQRRMLQAFWDAKKHRLGIGQPPEVAASSLPASSIPASTTEVAAHSTAANSDEPGEQLVSEIHLENREAAERLGKQLFRNQGQKAVRLDFDSEVSQHAAGVDLFDGKNDRWREEQERKRQDYKDRKPLQLVVAAQRREALNSEGTGILGFAMFSGLRVTMCEMCAWQCISSLPCLSRQWQRETQKEEWWQHACHWLGRQQQLHVPSTYSGDWKRLFFETLWPSRSAWQLDSPSAVIENFKVQVAVRLKPGEMADETKLFLPLHQRVQLLAEGESLDRDEKGLSVAAIRKMVESDVELPREVLEALMEAEALGHVSKLTRRQGRGPSRAEILCAFTGEQLLNIRVGRSDTVAELRRRVASDLSVSLHAVILVNKKNAVLDDDLLCNINRKEPVETSLPPEAETSSAEENKSAATRVLLVVFHEGTEGDFEFDGEALDADETVMPQPARTVATTVHAEEAIPGANATQPPMEGDMVSQDVTEGAKVAAQDQSEFEGAAAQAAEDENVPRRRNRARILAVQKARTVVWVPGAGVRHFHFARCFSPQVQQPEVYESSARDAVISFINGHNACLLCYGQTGSGKTYTAFGPEGALEEALSTTAAGESVGLPSSAGFVLRAVAEVLDAVKHARPSVRSSVSIEYVEIYQEQLTDLLTGRPVQLRDAGLGQFLLQGASRVQAESLTDALRLLQQGEHHKTRAATLMNERSSRAHTLFLVHLTRSSDSGTVLTSQLHMVDLAGSEQVKMSKAEGQRLGEAIVINTSLLVLGKCISALVEQRSHVPYYESKLTQLLKGAFGGNSRSVVLITGSMADDNGDQTLQSLRFGERCSMITNSARTAASSLSGALSAIDESLQTCRQSIASLEGRNMTHIESYRRLKERYQALLQKRHELADISEVGVSLNETAAGVKPPLHLASSSSET